MCPQRLWAGEHHLLSLCMLGEPLSTTSGAFTSTICLHLLPSGWFLCVFCLLVDSLFMLKTKIKTASLEQSRTALSNVIKSQDFVTLEMLPLE